MVVVLVLAQVLRQVTYAPREYRDLHLGRPRVPLVRPVLSDDLLFVLNYSQLLLSPLCSLLSLFNPFDPLCYHMHQLVSCTNGPRSAESTSYDSGLLYVAPNLPYELIYARESPLLPYALLEADVHNAPVEIPFEIEEMGLDTALGSPEGGSDPDVRTSSILLLAEAYEAGVDSAGRNHRFRIGQHVGRREAYRAAAPVSYDNFAPEHVGTSKEAGSLGHFSTGDESPYAGGADPTPHAPTPYPDAEGRTTRLPHEPAEVTEVAGGLVPETKVLPDYDHLSPTLADEHVLYELLWTLPGQGDVERYHPYLISPVSEKHLTP